ncbi:MAG: 30S ribosomal protein S20 [Bacteriovoracaceae bacterium]|nr:30S ribosomal protein S20 [Bacteriovoracaceae bacterium]
MPHHKSAKKRVRQTETRTLRNKIKTTQARGVEKKLMEFVAAGDKENAASILSKAQSLFAKLAKNGVIKPNTAARKASRLAKSVSKV